MFRVQDLGSRQVPDLASDPRRRQAVDIVNKCEFGGYGIKSSLVERDQNSCGVQPINSIVVRILKDSLSWRKE